MKRTFTLFLLLIGLSIAGSSAQAQWRVNTYFGYGFDDDIELTTSNGTFYSGTLKGPFIWGGGVEYVLQRNYGIEVLYMREDTDFEINYKYGVNNRDTTESYGTGLNFIMLSGNGYTPIPNSPLELFGSVMLGLGIFENKDAKPGASSSETAFSYGFRAGTNIWFSNSVGLKLMGQLVSGAQDFGGGFYVGTGGVSAGVAPESSMFQFGVGGGLTFKFGGTKKTKLPRM
ncbi:MAG: hypothetical protein K1X85_14760 [Ignavibacteria bacterium]|nr:hypothetical protein [Ignavibacteria bacterium]